MRHILIFMIVFLFSSSVNAKILKSDFMCLNTIEQNRLLESSYLTSFYFLGSAINQNSKIALKEIYSCMKDRDISWLRKTYLSFQEKYPSMASEFSQNLKHAIAWKCGLLTIE